MKLENPWKQNPWFESVAVAQERARKRLPQPVYGALVAGSERGQSVSDNEAAFAELGLAPVVAGQQAERDQATTLWGQEISQPVVISPTGVQAVHPDGEVAVARAASNRGTLTGLSNFASKSVEDVTASGARTMFQMYWTGERDVMLQRMQRAQDAGVVGLIATTDWSFSIGRDWGSPEIPEKVDLRTMVRFAPKVATKPRWLWTFGRTGTIPDLTAPNLAPPGEATGPTFFGAYYEWMTTQPPSWDDIAWMREQWQQISGGKPFVLKGVCRLDDALRAVDAGVSGISVSNHGGNNLDGTPAPIRVLAPIAERVGGDIEVVLDGGVRRGSDVVKALALGARAVLIGRAYLWGLAANGEEGVGNVLDILRMGVDSALRGMGLASIHELTPEHLIVPDGFHRTLGGTRPGSGTTMILAEATSPETAEADLVLVPVGSLEQHGPHLPLDTDTTVAVAVAEAAAEQLPGSWVAPPVAYGASGEHQHFAGTVSVGHVVLRAVVVELVRSLRCWARRAVLVNGHGGNVRTLDSAVAQLVAEGHDVAWVPCAVRDGDLHAGRTETSLMLHLRPASVRLERAVRGDTRPLAQLLPTMLEGGVAAVTGTGVLGDPAGASAHEGERLLAEMVDAVLERLAVVARR